MKGDIFVTESVHYTAENPPPGHTYGGIVGFYKGKWYNGVGEWVDVSRGMLVERTEAGDSSCLYFERTANRSIEEAKESARKQEERRLKREAGHGYRASGKARRRGTRGAFGGRRK